MDTALMIVLI